MQATAVMATALLDTMGDGAYEVKDGELYKGDINLSQNADFFDTLKQQSGYNATLFYGDTRYVTTLTDENGNKQLQTKASDIVVNEVQKNENEYKNDSTDVLEVRYVSYYIPVYQTGTNDITGMLFIGRQQCF